jgi:hypothetical protein
MQSATPTVHATNEEGARGLIIRTLQMKRTKKSTIKLNWRCAVYPKLIFSAAVADEYLQGSKAGATGRIDRKLGLRGPGRVRPSKVYKSSGMLISFAAEYVPCC